MENKEIYKYLEEKGDFVFNCSCCKLFRTKYILFMCTYFFTLKSTNLQILLNIMLLKDSKFLYLAESLKMLKLDIKLISINLFIVCDRVTFGTQN